MQARPDRVAFRLWRIVVLTIEHRRAFRAAVQTRPSVLADQFASALSRTGLHISST